MFDQDFAGAASSHQGEGGCQHEGVQTRCVSPDYQPTNGLNLECPHASKPCTHFLARSLSMYVCMNICMYVGR